MGAATVADPAVGSDGTAPTLTQAENGNGYLSSMPDGHEFNLGPPIKATNGDLVPYIDAGGAVIRQRHLSLPIEH